MSDDENGEEDARKESGQSPGEFPSNEELRETLLKKGWIETTALVEPDTEVPSRNNSGQARSAGAARKAEQRERDLAAGWKQHNVKAPDDADARELLSFVAQVIKSKKARQIIRVALADPDLIRIGRRVRRLGGEPGTRVRQLLGL